MSNQAIHWSLFIVPWLTLFLVKKEDIKRYMPVALLATVLATIIHDVGITLGLWTLKETVFPFNEMTPYLYGAILVAILWVFKFTYGHLGKYALTSLIVHIFLNFLFLNIFLPSRGILILNVSPFLTLPITLIHAVLLYSYQVWQEGIFSRSESPSYSSSLQPAAAKPLPQNQDPDNNNGGNLK